MTPKADFTSRNEQFEVITEVQATPEINPQLTMHLANAGQIGLTAIVLIVLGGAAVAGLLKFWVVPKNNEALVISGLGHGKKGPKTDSERAIAEPNVVTSGGAIIVPFFTEVTRVPLYQVEVGAEVTHYTKDKLRIEVKAKCFVCVIREETAIIKAARSLATEREVTKEQILDRVVEQLTDKLRNTIFKMEFEEILQEKQQLSEDVKAGIKEDLACFGLTPLDVAVEDVKQIPVSEADCVGNVLNAEAFRKQEEVIAEADVERARIRKEAEKKRLQIEEEQATIEEEQRKRVEKLKEETAREIAVNKLTEEQVTKLAEINKETEIRKQEEQAESDRQTAVAERETAIEQAKAKKAEDIAVAHQNQRTAEENAQIEIAKVEKTRFEAEAERIAAKEATITVEQKAEQNRKKELAIIAASQEAETKAVEITVKAEAEKEAAELAAQSKLSVAELEAQALTAVASAQLESDEKKAKGLRELNEAENAKSNEQRAFEAQMQLLATLGQVAPELVENLPSIVEAAAKGADFGKVEAYFAPGAEGGGMDQLADFRVKNSAAGLLASLASTVGNVDLMGNVMNLISPATGTSTTEQGTSEAPTEIEITEESAESAQ